MRPPTSTPPPPAPAAGLDPADRDPADRDPTGCDLTGHRRAVWTYLRMLGAKATDADDLTQEALLVLVRQQVPPPAPRRFLLRTARNLFFGSRRAERRRPQPTAWIEAVDRTWHAQAASGDWLDALERCRARLSERQRRALHLHYGRGLRFDEAAPELGLRPNGLKTLLQRVRAALRTCLEETIS